MKEDEMVGCHQRLNGYEFEQAAGDGEGQGQPGVLRFMGSEESDTSVRLNNSNNTDKR